MNSNTAHNAAANDRRDHLDANLWEEGQEEQDVLGACASLPAELRATYETVADALDCDAEWVHAVVARLVGKDVLELHPDGTIQPVV